MEKTLSLRKNGDFIRVYRKGRYYAGKYMVLYVLNNRTGENRLGISVSKKNGKSTVRNRIRRLIKESYRLNEKKMRGGVDIVFNARPTGTVATYGVIEKEMIFLIRKLGVFTQEQSEC